MKFRTNGSSVEITNDGVYVDGTKVSDDQASQMTGTTIIGSSTGPLNTGGGRQVNVQDDDGAWTTW